MADKGEQEGGKREGQRCKFHIAMGPQPHSADCDLIVIDRDLIAIDCDILRFHGVLTKHHKHAARSISRSRDCKHARIFPTQVAPSQCRAGITYRKARGDACLTVNVTSTI